MFFDVIAYVIMRKMRSKVLVSSKIKSQALDIDNRGMGVYTMHDIEHVYFSEESKKLDPAGRELLSDLIKMSKGEVEGDINRNVRYTNNGDAKIVNFTAIRGDQCTDGSYRIIATYKDINKDITAKEDYNKVTSRYTYLMEDSFVGIALFDGKGKLIQANKRIREMFKDNGSNKDWLNLFASLPVSKDIEYKNPYKMIASTHICMPQYDIDFWSDATVTPLRDENGVVDSFIVTMLDVSDMRKVYLKLSKSTEEYKRANKQMNTYSKLLKYVVEENLWASNALSASKAGHSVKDDGTISLEQRRWNFLENLSHEIRTPLNSIVGFSQVMSDISPEEGTQLESIIRRNCSSLLNIIDDMIELSDIDSKGVQLQEDVIDFADCFNKACDYAKTYIEKKDVKFLSVNPYESLKIVTDKSCLDKIIRKIVHNAYKYTERGHITLGYDYIENSLQIYCEDTGKGIPDTMQPKIFDRFYKVDRFIPGAGLGLSVCKSLVEGMGGTIKVKSEDGAGSRFTVVLPCNKVA